jgi:hypothetical protein
MALCDEMIRGILALYLENVGFANVGDVTGLLPSGTAGNLWVALHTADPGPSGNQSTFEVSYGSYARMSIPRGTGSFTMAGNVFSLANLLSFPQATSGSVTCAFASIGTASSGAGHLHWSGAISPAIAVVTGVIPELTPATTFTLS